MKKLIAIPIISVFLFSSCACEPVPNEKLQLKVGETIELSGTLSETPWQHMINIQEAYPYIAYVDFEDGDQLVVYTKNLPVCYGEVKFKGTVIEIEGESKNPDSDEKYTEIQITADELTCDGEPINDDVPLELENAPLDDVE